MEPVIDHIEITVRDMVVAVDEHECHVVEYSHPRLAFAITSPRS
jgi:hypothetical protein